MSKAILWIGLILSAAMLLVGVTTAGGKSFAMLFWLLIAVGCIYKLFIKKV